MKVEIEDQPAFPVKINSDIFTGVNIREYLAGLAMQGLVTARGKKDELPFSGYDMQTIAKESVEQADYLITELKRKYK